MRKKESSWYDDQMNEKWHNGILIQSHILTLQYQPSYVWQDPIDAVQYSFNEWYDTSGILYCLTRWCGWYTLSLASSNINHAQHRIGRNGKPKHHAMIDLYFQNYQPHYLIVSLSQTSHKVHNDNTNRWIIIHFCHLIFDGVVLVHNSDCMDHVDIKLQAQVPKQSLKNIFGRHVWSNIINNF